MIQRVEDGLLVAAFVVGFLIVGGPAALTLLIPVLAVATVVCFAGRLHGRRRDATHPPRAR